MPRLPFIEVLYESPHGQGAGDIARPGKRGRWVTKDKSGLLEAEFKIPLSRITAIDLANYWSASVHVEVGKDRETLLFSQTLMSRLDCHQGNSATSVFFYTSEHFNQSVAAKKWDRVRVVCKQTSRVDAFGLSMLVVHGEEVTREDTSRGNSTAPEDVLGSLIEKAAAASNSQRKSNLATDLSRRFSFRQRAANFFRSQDPEGQLDKAQLMRLWRRHHPEVEDALKDDLESVLTRHCSGSKRKRQISDNLAALRVEERDCKGGVERTPTTVKSMDLTDRKMPQAKKTRTEREGTFSVQCPMCFKSFSQSEVIMHSSSCNGGEDDTTRCPVCGIFVSPDEVGTHVPRCAEVKFG